MDYWVKHEKKNTLINLVCYYLPPWLNLQGKNTRLGTFTFLINVIILYYANYTIDPICLNESRSLN